MKIQAYTCMTKKRIQMYDKKTQKTAYKCMTKIRVQTRIQMYDKNTHTNTHTNV